MKTASALFILKELLLFTADRENENDIGNIGNSARQVCLARVFMRNMQECSQWSRENRTFRNIMAFADMCKPFSITKAGRRRLHQRLPADIQLFP